MTFSAVFAYILISEIRDLAWGLSRDSKTNLLSNLLKLCAKRGIVVFFLVLHYIFCILILRDILEHGNGGLCGPQKRGICYSWRKNLMIVFFSSVQA